MGELLARLTRERRHMPLHADLDDVDEPLRLGDPAAPHPPARYIGDAATLVRLYAGLPVGGASCELGLNGSPTGQAYPGLD